MQITEPENKRFHANRGFILLDYIIITCLVFLAIRLVMDFSFLLPVVRTAFIWLEVYLWRLFPFSYVLVAVIVALCLYGRIATVSVNRAEVTIKKGFHKPVRIPLDSCKFVPHKKITAKDYKIRHFYLRAIKADGAATDYRLRCFTEGAVSQLFSAINAYQTAAMPSDIRSEVAYEDLVAGEKTFHVIRNQVMKIEWAIYRSYAGIILVTALAIVLLPSKFLMRSWYESLQWYHVRLVAVCAVISLPFMAVRLAINIKRCPYKISRNGAFLYFDDRCFSLGEISQVIMTDANAKSDSIFPLNRYIRVSANGKKYTYWLGSELCLTAQEYQGLCRDIERMFINTPFKVVYKTK